MATEHTSLVADPHVWVLVSAIIFAVVAYKKGRAPLLQMLDARSEKIRCDLDEAARLRSEAEALLEDYKQKHKDAVQTTQRILENAKISAAQMHHEAEEKLTENIRQKEELLLGRIARAELAAVQELRARAADLAIEATEKILLEEMPKRQSQALSKAIDDLPAALN